MTHKTGANLRQSGHRQDLGFCTLSLQRRQLLLWYYFTDLFSHHRVFPHSESRPQGPSRVYHLGKHFLYIRLLFAWRGDRGLFVLWTDGYQGYTKFLRRAAFQVILNISHFLYDFERRLYLINIFKQKPKDVLYSVVGRSDETQLLQMRTCLKIHTSYRNNMLLLWSFTGLWLDRIGSFCQKCGSKIPLPQEPLFDSVQEEIDQGKPRVPSNRKESVFHSAVFRKMSF